MAREYFSRRTDWNQEHNLLSQTLDELKAKGKSIIDLTESNPTRCGINYPAEILNSLSDPKNLNYIPDSRGMESARKFVAHFCGADVSKTMLTASTSESYSYLFRLLLNPGDKVLIPSPSYPLFQFLLELNDAKFESYPLVYDNGTWRIDFDVLKTLIDAKTKAIILVNPNNPTGSYIKAEELKKLNTICRVYGLAIISDEVFYDYALQKGDFVSLKGNQQSLTFVLGGLSKSLCLPQMKLGWILASGPATVVEEALNRLEIIADTFLSVNTPVQNAVAVWLNKAKDIQNQVMERVSGNLRTLLESQLTVLTVEGGWNAILKMGKIDEEGVVIDILHHHQILVHPGFFFDIEPSGHLVLSLLPPSSDFDKIVPIIKEYM
jgi:alanine-synthesizing transaminase